MHDWLQRGRQRAAVCVVVLSAIATACGESGAVARNARDEAGAHGGATASTARAEGSASGISPVTEGNAVQSLALAAGRDPRAYRVVNDTTALTSGAVIGSVMTTSPVPSAAVVEPAHDRGVCSAFTETLVPSVDGGVGNAVVWLVGVTHGPPQQGPRRAALSLERCRFEPRVQRAVVGGTLQLTSRDAMSSRWRFLDLGRDAHLRTLVSFTDAGQVVPTSGASQTPGLVEVRDDLHPWARAYVAIAPHPFVAVTPPTGEFRFEGVPEGTYTIVVWQEQLGVRFQTVRVTAGVESRMRIAF